MRFKLSIDSIFKDKKYNKNKLLNFGFKYQSGCYSYSTGILDNQFELTVTINKTGKIKTKLIDNLSKDLYTLHLMEGASGTFVGQVREEYEKILNSILENCFDMDVFKSPVTLKIIDYCVEKYSTNPEYLWEKFPNNAIFRRKDNKKWYAAILTVRKDKLGFIESDEIEVIDLRCNNIENTVDNKNFFPGYHMNKKHWITIILDGTVTLDIIENMVDKSFELAQKK